MFVHKGENKFIFSQITKQDCVQVLEGEKLRLHTRGQSYRCALHIGSACYTLGSVLHIGQFGPVLNYTGTAHRSVRCALGLRAVH